LLDTIHKINIDIETRSGYDLTKVGVYEYVESPDFSILKFGYKINDGTTYVIDTGAGEEIPIEIWQAIYNKDIEKRAWNAQFERIALGKFRGMLNGGRDMRIDPRDNWHCTMIEAMACGLPAALGRCAAALNVETQKMTEGKALIQLFSVPQKATKKRPQGGFVSPDEFPEKWNMFGVYCGADVDAEHDIEMRLKSYNLIPQAFMTQLWEQYAMDQLINDAGVPVNVQALEVAQFIDDTRRAQLEYELRDRGIEKPTSPASIKRWLASQGFNVASFDKKAREDLIRENQLPPFIKETIELCAELLSKASQKPLAMLNYARTTGYMRGTLQFIGANRTGRWSGRGPQLQNLKRNPDDAQESLDLMLSDTRTFYNNTKNVRETIGGMSRLFIQAPIGKKFVVVDYSAIEARVLAWIAGEHWVLDVFKDKRDIYVETAARMFRSEPPIPPRDKTEAEQERYDAELKVWGLRSKGKVAVLALGYQGGEGAMAAMDFKKEIPEHEYEQIKNDFRAANANIVTLWNTVNDTLVMLAQDVQNATSTLSSTHTAIQASPTAPLLHFALHPTHDNQCALVITLPSGRPLVYQDFRPALNRWGHSSVEYMAAGEAEGGMYGVAYRETYGGKVVENITQAIARDLLAETLLKTMQYNPLFSVHDEGIWLVDENDAEHAFNDISAIMATPPVWAQDLPLDSAGGILNNYEK